MPTDNYVFPTPIPNIYAHSVAPKKNMRWVNNWLTLELDIFISQIKYLKENYDTVFLHDIYLHKKGEKRLRSDSVAIQFDDGYLDNWIYVFPILKKYNLKATIFVSPEFVDRRNVVRRNLDDYWDGKVAIGKLENWGFLSWNELRLMEGSGLVDIQSHTASHTKYYVSDELVGFHNPYKINIYPICNLYPEMKPYYIGNDDFIRLIPFGYPLFKESSSVVSKRVFISDDFITEIRKSVSKYDFFDRNKMNLISDKIRDIYNKYRNNNSIISRCESHDEFEERLIYELKASKQIIGDRLGKEVKFCCWPHGENDEYAHHKALELGYLATSIGKMRGRISDASPDRFFDRFGFINVRNNRNLSKIRFICKIKSFQRIQPFSILHDMYRKFRPCP